MVPEEGGFSGAFVGRVRFSILVPLSVSVHIVDIDITDRTERSVLLLEDDRRVAGMLETKLAELTFTM